MPLSNHYRSYGQIFIIGEIDCPTPKQFNSPLAQNSFSILERIFRKFFCLGKTFLVDLKSTRCKKKKFYPPAEVRPRPQNGCINYFTKRFFSSKFLILPPGLPRRRSSPKIAARWRYRLPSKSLTAHYNSQCFVSFHRCFDQDA